MATSLDQVQTEKQVEQGSGKEYGGPEIEMAVRLGAKILKEGGLEIIKKAIDQSQDPAQVVGQFLSQIMAKLAEQMRDQYGADPGMFLAKGGWLDYMLDFIEGQLGYPEEFSDQVYSQVLEIIKAAAMSPPAPNNVMGQQGAATTAQAPQQQPQQEGVM